MIAWAPKIQDDATNDVLPLMDAVVNEARKFESTRGTIDFGSSTSYTNTMSAAPIERCAIHEA